MGNSVKNWDDGERALGSLATSSELGFQWISSNWDDCGSLERSLPVVNEEFCPELG